MHVSSIIFNIKTNFRSKCWVPRTSTIFYTLKFLLYILGYCSKQCHHQNGKSQSASMNKQCFTPKKKKIVENIVLLHPLNNQIDFYFLNYKTRVVNGKTQYTCIQLYKNNMMTDLIDNSSNVRFPILSSIHIIKV